MKLKKELFRNYINLFGLKTKQRIIVIESDDWGSTKVQNNRIFESLVNSNISVNNILLNLFSFNQI